MSILIKNTKKQNTCESFKKSFIEYNGYNIVKLPDKGNDALYLCDGKLMYINNLNYDKSLSTKSIDFKISGNNKIIYIY